MDTRSKQSHIFAKATDGWYMEPEWCSRRLFEVEKFAPLIYDPACGAGTILKSAKAAGYKVIGSDLVNRGASDFRFLSRDFPKRKQRLADSCDIVVNPPFDHVQKFCEHALALGANKVAVIMLVRRLNAAHWLQQLPLETIYLLTPRPSMPPGVWIMAGNKPGGGTQDFVWMVFRRGYRGKPRLKWLHRQSSQNRYDRPPVKNAG